MRIPEPPLPVPRHEAAAIVCFVVAPKHRRQGVARSLLEAGLASFGQRGIKLVDAFPWNVEAGDDKPTDFYHGACDVHDGGVHEARRARERHRRTKAAVAHGNTAAQSGGSTYAAAARPCGALRCCHRLREPAAVLAVDHARCPTTPFWPFAPWPLRFDSLRRIFNVLAYVPSRGLRRTVATSRVADEARADRALVPPSRFRSRWKRSQMLLAAARREPHRPCGKQPWRASWRPGWRIARARGTHAARALRASPRGVPSGQDRRPRPRAACVVARRSSQSRHPAVRGDIRRGARHGRRLARRRPDTAPR